MKKLLSEIRDCKVCAEDLPVEVRPVVVANNKSRIVIIGQAPGLAVHKSGIPWDDKSGDNLRNWMGVEKEKFYNPELFAIIPMGFCYPGRGKTGDLPPRKECAPLWHKILFEMMPGVRMVMLIGNYAQKYYLQKRVMGSLTETVKNFKEYLPEYFVLPHPSPRNNIWQAKNAWFPEIVLPELKKNIREITEP